MIPKLSAPLLKDIRTGEGLAEYAVGAGIAALGVCQDLSFGKTATYLTILTALKGARRGLIKLVAVLKAAGVGDPTAETGQSVVAGARRLVGIDPGAVLSDIELAAKAIAAYQDQSFTGDPSTIKAGLSPSRVRVASAAAVPTAAQVSVPPVSP